MTEERQQYPINVDGKAYTKEEYEAAFCDDCACGAKKPDVRAGCDDCEPVAMNLWHEKRSKLGMPDGWTRTFEPQWSCGPYYLYFKTPPDREKHEDYPFTACQLGVCMNIEPTGSFSHLEAQEAVEICAVLGIAIEDHRALRDLVEGLSDHVAKLNEVERP